MFSALKTTDPSGFEITEWRISHSTEDMESEGFKQKRGSTFRPFFALVLDRVSAGIGFPYLATLRFNTLSSGEEDFYHNILKRGNVTFSLREFSFLLGK